MLTATIELHGETETDIELALDEVRRLVGEGFTSGHNSNDTGKFTFNISEGTGS